MNENLETHNLKFALIEDDPWLEPYANEVKARLERVDGIIQRVSKSYGSLRAFAEGYNRMGILHDAQAGGWFYREWAPGARELFLSGDFNDWSKTSHPLKKMPSGVWELFLPDGGDGSKLVHGSRVKVHVVGGNGSRMDRIPAWIHRVIQDPVSHDFSGQIWAPDSAFEWTDQHFKIPQGAPFIYESHTGMAQEREGLGTYREFADIVLPRIVTLGYNCIQMMAVQEHPYYGSFGYHVSNFFAPSSRFGTPEDLKYLINKCHENGVAFIMDVVHSHAVKNFAEGLNEFDGTEDHYFHPGGRGYHTSWDSKLFNYGKQEVQEFLLSNLAYWMEEFHIDGFRFDGVTSMLYFHHGDHVSFDHYDKYFKDGVEWDSIAYLQLANELIHQINPDAITIAEDMSGMPGTCRKVSEGGLGFDYRLAMGIPDYWIKLLKHSRDEDWNIHEIWSVLTNRRWKEKSIAYAESHDQALVGDKTLAFWLMDKEMYFHMQVSDKNLIIDRGIGLHKLIRLVTASLGGEGYLTFIGNEFGHPEWIDFPREGNGWSYKYARRQWSLADDPNLKYHYLKDFDQAMVQVLKSKKVLESGENGQQLNMDDENHVMVYLRANLVFVFNFHPTRSIADYKFVVPEAGKYRIILSTEDGAFGGFDRVDTRVEHFTIPDEFNNHFLSLYVTNRTAFVLEKIG